MKSIKLFPFLMIFVLLSVSSLNSQQMTNTIAILSQQENQTNQNNMSFPYLPFNSMQERIFDSTSVVDSVLTYDETVDFMFTQHFYYNEEINPVLLSGYYFDNGNNSWQLAGKEENEYDSTGNLTVSTSKMWMGDDWQMTKRLTYSYDSSGNITSENKESWTYDPMSMNWVKEVSRTLYTYDSNNNLIEKVNDNLSGGIWKHYSKFTVSYDEDNFPTVSTYQSWSDYEWKNVYKYTFQYSSGANIEKRLYKTYYYIWATDNWAVKWQSVNQYDSTGMLNSQKYKYWYASDWHDSLRNSYTYDNNGNVTVYLQEIMKDSVWANHYKKSFLYDLDGNTTEFYSLKWKGGSWAPYPSNLEFRDSFGRKFSYQGSSIQISYLPVEDVPVTGIKTEKINTGDFKLEQNYPNPFNPATTINYSIPYNKKTGNVKLVVFDVLGREVATLVNQKQAPGNYEITFNANNLPSGLYLYKLTAGKFSVTRKMLLLK